MSDALQFWLQPDWESPAEAIGIVDEYLHAARPVDPVQLAIASGSLTEEDAGERIIELLGELPSFSRYAGPHLPDLTVFEGEIPADVR